MKLLLQYLKPYRIFIIITLITKISGTLVELAIPYILSYIIDSVVPTHRVSLVVFWGVMMIFCALCALVLNIWANRFAVRVARSTTEQIRSKLFESTMRLSSRQIDEFTVPSLESRLTSDTYNIHSFVGFTMRMGVRAPILLFGGIAVTAFLEPVLTLVMVTIIPFIGLVVWLITKKGIPLFKKAQRSVDRMVGVVREDTQGIRVIKALSKNDYECRRYDEANRNLASDEKKAEYVMSASNPSVTFLLNAGLVSVIVVGAWRVMGGVMLPGKIIAFMQYFTLISNAMIGVTKIFVNYSKGSASADRISAVINTEPDFAVASENLYPVRGDNAHIVFENVSFSYKKVKNNIENISFRLKKGQTLGIIGATGSGKTTILQLLMRNYDVDSGSIRIDGRDLRTIPAEELRAKFGTAMQNDFIFSASAAENIKFGRDISDEDMEKAAESACALEFINAYPDRFEHKFTSKGTNISGGQKQRIFIARAIAAKPEILLLDDSFSALDYKTDSAVRRNLRENLAGTTTIVVAQRVSSVMNADLILVLDEGRIIGSGTHDELIESCKVYRQISESQTGGAILD